MNPLGDIAFNPNTNPATPYAVTADSKIPFYYKASGDSMIFPQAKWPTPRQVWGINPTERGYDGMWYCYGFDALVAKLGSSCTKNKKWTLVHQNVTVTKKRSDEEDRVFSHPSSHHLKTLGQKFEQEVAKGRSHEEVLHSMIMESCETKPKIQLNDRLLKWISMNNLHISSFDTLCDKPSERYEQMFGKKEDQTQNASETGVPLWVIITASVGSALFVIAVIILIVLYVKKTGKGPGPAEGAYIQMKE